MIGKKKHITCDCVFCVCLKYQILILEHYNCFTNWSKNPKTGHNVPSNGMCHHLQKVILYFGAHIFRLEI